MTDEHEHAMKVAEQAYSAGNLVTCDGYYEFDLDAAAAVIAADRAGLLAEIERLWSLLEGRDKFIVQTGLFSDFVDYLRTQGAEP